MHHAGFKRCGAVRSLSRTPPPSPLMPFGPVSSFMNRRMPRPEDVSREHIDATVIGFLTGEKDADWTEVSLVTLHPREEIRLVLRENANRYRTLSAGRFRELVGRLRYQGVLYGHA